MHENGDFHTNPGAIPANFSRHKKGALKFLRFKKHSVKKSLKRLKEVYRRDYYEQTK
jgi:hypothetical protein